MRLAPVVAAALLLAACGTITTNYAIYRHPTNGDVMTCEVLHSGGVVSNVPSVFSGGPYADCKNVLEERGYVRAGTEHWPRQASTPEEAAIPRPAPTQ